MKRVILAACMATLVAGSVTVMAAPSNDAVCKDLKSMISKQKKTYHHYQQVHANSNINMAQAKKDIKKYQRAAKQSQQNVMKLKKQLADEQQRLDQASKMMKMAQQRVRTSNQTLTTVTPKVMNNEQELLESLNKQYRDMCAMRTYKSQAPAAAPQPAQPKAYSGYRSSSDSDPDNQDLQKQYYP